MMQEHCDECEISGSITQSDKGYRARGQNKS